MLRRLCLAFVVPGAVLCVSSCDAGGGGAPSQGRPTDDPALQPENTASVLTYTEPTTRCRFAMPDIGLRVAAEHYDASTPPQKMKHSIAITGVAGPVLRIDIWNNTESLGLQDWFDKYLSFVVSPGATVERRLVGKSHVNAIVVDQARSPQSQARRIVTFAHPERVFRVTCFDSDDATAQDVLQHVLDSFDHFDPEAGP